MTTLVHQESPQDFQVFNKTIHPDLAGVVEDIVRLPAMQRLSGLIEKNAYHNSEEVLEHMAKVFANCQELLKLDFITSSKLKNRYATYFKESVDAKGKYSHGDLLLLASVIHDVGKGVEKEEGITYFQVVDGDGNTEAFGHEDAGAALVPSLLESTGLAQSEVEFVGNIVKAHNTFSEEFCSASLKKDPQQDAEVIRETNPLYMELLLHILADNWGVLVYKEWSDYFMNKLLNSVFFMKD